MLTYEGKKTGKKTGVGTRFGMEKAMREERKYGEGNSGGKKKRYEVKMKKITTQDKKNEVWVNQGHQGPHLNL